MIDRYGHEDDIVERYLVKKQRQLYETLKEMAPVGLRIVNQIEAKEKRNA